MWEHGQTELRDTRDGERQITNLGTRKFQSLENHFVTEQGWFIYVTMA